MATAVTPPFAQAIADMVAAVAPMLGNASATLDGEPVTGIYTNGHALASVGPFGMASSQPDYTLPSASVPANVIGKLLIIGEDTDTTGETRYTVVASEPDGTGLTRLVLERA